jgi:hypothetical protein
MNKSCCPPRARGASPIHAHTAPLADAIHTRTLPRFSEATR